MKHIFLNLKRFDISPAKGGVNRICKINDWGGEIVKQTQDQLKQFEDVEFAQFFPEAHLIKACEAKTPDSLVNVGTQGLHWGDTAVGGPFGAFTSSLTGNAAAEIGCTYALIGHCEERNKLAYILAEAGVTDTAAVNIILNKEILAAQKAGLKVLYCIGEKDTELDAWDKVLEQQVKIGLEGADLSTVSIGYEPVWSIGPGKTPADKPYITKVAKLIKSLVNVPVVYGGGLKKDNAAMLASIEEIDGGLIALTQFTGEIGFYPEQYIEIIKTYLEAK